MPLATPLRHDPILSQGLRNILSVPYKKGNTLPETLLLIYSHEREAAVLSRIHFTLSILVRTAKQLLLLLIVLFGLTVMQRSRIRRSQGVKKLRGRVVSIKDVAQWQKLLNKIGEKLLVANFFAVRSDIFDLIPLHISRSMIWQLFCLQNKSLPVQGLTLYTFQSAAMEFTLQTDEVIPQRSVFETVVLARGVC